MKKLLTLVTLSILTSTQVLALDILCVDRDLMDSQITAHFVEDSSENLSVTVGIPTGETSSEDAIGTCVVEEDTDELSLRCDEVRTKSGELYFARIDGNEATVALNGEIIASIPCSSDKSQKLSGRDKLLLGEEVLVDRGRYCDKKLSYNKSENSIYEISNDTFKGEYSKGCSKTAGLKVRIYKCSGDMYNCKWIDYVRNNQGSYVETHVVNINSSSMELKGRIKFSSCRSRSCHGSSNTLNWKLIL